MATKKSAAKKSAAKKSSKRASKPKKQSAPKQTAAAPEPFVEAPPETDADFDSVFGEDAID